MRRELYKVVLGVFGVFAGFGLLVALMMALIVWPLQNLGTWTLFISVPVILALLVEGILLIDRKGWIK